MCGISLSKLEISIDEKYIQCEEKLKTGICPNSMNNLVEEY
jgi:hypothetical protein